MPNRYYLAVLLLIISVSANSQRVFNGDSVRVLKTNTDKLQFTRDSIKFTSDTVFLVIDSKGLVGKRYANFGTTSSTTSARYRLPYNGNPLYYLAGDTILRLLPSTYTKPQVDSAIVANKTSGGNYKLPYNGNANYYLGGDSALHLLSTTTFNSRSGAIVSQFSDYSTFYQPLGRYIDSLRRVGITVSAHINGAWIPQFTDSVGTGTVQVNSDWNATSGVAQILNKPTIVTQTTAAQTITATAGQTVFAFTSVPSTSTNFIIFVNGGRWDTTGYTYSGNNVTTTTALDLGDKISLVQIK